MLSWKPVLALLLFFTCVNGGLVVDVLNALEKAVSCNSCRALLVPLQGLAALGDTKFSSAVIAICNTLRVRCVYIYMTRSF